MSDEVDPRLPDMRKREVQIVHIEGLQATLTRRNARIEQLEAQIAEGGNSPAQKAAIKKAFKRGWTECAQRLMAATSQAAGALTTINREAWQEYLNSEQLEREEAVDE